MGDLSHLEKMGRELKCPICLSLLNCAASLGCNHVFCNACIEKSMKSGSNCPVCKVPYRRREVRPAPHMDNLVSIYKSMEVAAGVNIFVTQNLSSAKLSEDSDRQVEGDVNCSKWLNAKNSEISADKQIILGSGPLKMRKSNRKNSVSSPVKPSFPKKKRVQVPQCPLSETPTRPAKFASRFTKMNDKELTESAVVLGDKAEPVLSPFFWLRERDEGEEKSSQHSDQDQPPDSTTPNVLSFSDIKDSVDESPSKVPMEEVCGKSSNDFDLFDSEMFEWTQRACSPELCSSPFKLQVDNNVTTEPPLSVTSPDEEPRNEKPNENSYQNGSIPDMVVDDLFSPEGNHAKDRKKLRKRGKKEISLKKCANRYIESALGNSSHLAKRTECLSQKQGCDVSDDSLKIGTERRKKGQFGVEAHQTALENVRAAPIRLETPNDVPEKRQIGTKRSKKVQFDIGAGISAYSDGEKVSQFPEKSCRNGKDKAAVDRRKRSKKAKLVSVGNELLEEPSFNQNQQKDCAIPSLTTSTSAIAASTDQKMGLEKHAKSSPVCMSNNADDNNIQEEHVNAQAMPSQLADKLKCNTDARPLGNFDSKAKKVRGQKRKSLDNELHCAFCHSSEESEASGRMAHYFNGKPINSNDIKNPKVVHAHWNCIEWAPNVYFDDDTAINLEAELSRSRKIKCSCCGNKGAALGCFEKSCRKSFHVPCAKSMPQCQWDTDNFVMLCPLHPDSELPSQSSAYQNRKTNPTPKRQPHTKNIAAAHDMSNNRSSNFRELSKKLVLCCSALATAERGAVSEFQRLSGVTVLQKWDDSVTHVIASTDENAACKRTLKILMGILKGKWVLNVEWIKACIQAMGPVEEERYEISVDVHGIRDGPRLGRLRVLNNQPKLFAGFNVFFTADFVPSYKGYLQELVTAAGGTILLRKPVPSSQSIHFSSSTNGQVFIIYSLELPENCDPPEKDRILDCRRSDAMSLARSSAAKVATNSWLLNSIAGSKLESLPE